MMQNLRRKWDEPLESSMELSAIAEQKYFLPLTSNSCGEKPNAGFAKLVQPDKAFAAVVGSVRVC